MKRILFLLAAGNEVVKYGIVREQGMSSWLTEDSASPQPVNFSEQKQDPAFLAQDPAMQAWATDDPDCDPMPPCEQVNFTTCCDEKYGNGTPNATVLAVCTNLYNCCEQATALMIACKNNNNCTKYKQIQP